MWNVEVSSGISKSIYRNQIVAEDLNCAPQPHLDKLPGNTSDGGRKTLQDYGARNTLVDIWRKRNPGIKQFTWQNKNRTVASQIDYWRVSNSLADATERCYIMTCTLSDHQPVALTFPIEYFTRGPGPVLEINVDVLKEELLKVMVTNAWKDWQKAKASMEIRQWWDVGKANIKQVIQEYCTLKKQFEMAEEERLENNLEELNRIAEPDQNTLRKTHSMESTLRDAQWQKTEGARIRARVKHPLERGEQNTAFFFRQIKKNMPRPAKQCCKFEQRMAQYKAQRRSLYWSVWRNFMNLFSNQSNLQLKINPCG